MCPKDCRALRPMELVLLLEGTLAELCGQDETCWIGGHGQHGFCWTGAVGGAANAGVLLVLGLQSQLWQAPVPTVLSPKLWKGRHDGT